MTGDSPRRLGDVLEAVVRRATVPVLLAVGIVTTVPGNWLRVQNVDPEFSMVLVQRAIHFGGTFYDNAVQDHGPIEPFLYDVAARLGGRNGAWYVVSALVTLVSLVVAYVAARVARFTGASREIGILAGAAVFVHLTISRSNYAGVLYIRNITTCLLTLAFLVVIADRPWSTPRRARVSAVVIGALLGLAVQSLFTTAFAAGVLGIVAIGVGWTHLDGERRIAVGGTMAAAAVVAFASAPVYYAARGDWTEFWSGWVRYGRYMSVGTGRSTREQVHLGWDKLFAYYQQRPLAFLVILAFAIALPLLWRSLTTRERIVHAGLLAWWFAGWVELVISQRYSAEYFVVTSIPTAFMAAALAGHAWRHAPVERLSPRLMVAVPLVGALVAVYLCGPTTFANDERAAWHFRGVNANQAHADKFRSGPERTALAVLDLVSHDGDPVLMWTNDPWPYLNVKRVAATRFFYKSFLLGEIYLGRTSTSYVLPHTWEWFAQDLRQSDPVAYVRADEPSLPGGTPFASYVAAHFEVVTPDAVEPVSLRSSVARAILEPSASRAWAAPEAPGHDSGWTVDGTSAQYRPGGAPTYADELTIARDSCFRLEGVITRGGTTGTGHVVFHFVDNAGRTEQLNLTFDGDTVSSSSNFVEYLRLPSGVPARAGRVPFALVVGRRSAAVVVAGQVRAAVVIPPSVTVRAEANDGPLGLEHLELGAAPAGSGCPA